MRTFIKRYGCHALLLLVGSTIFLAGCFHNGIWFDEAYTVGLMQHPLWEVISLSSYDVHPQLYYILLKLFTLLFGNTLPVMRIFSSIGGISFAALGITHIRRDFGARAGFWFSFCALFSGCTLYYCLQIRMYTWSAFFTSLALIYAFRMGTRAEERRDRICFLVFSVCAAYTHYFALFTVAAANLLLLYRTRKATLPQKVWLQNAAVQIGAYLPAVFVLLRQMLAGGPGWMKITWPDVVFDFCSYYALGMPLYDSFSRFGNGADLVIYTVTGGIFTVLFVAAGILLRRQYKKNVLSGAQKSAVREGLIVYVGVILFSLIVSLFRPLYYIRYTVVLSGLLCFALALLLSSLRRPSVRAVIATLLLLTYGTQAAIQFKMNADPSNDRIISELTPQMQPEDVFLFDDIQGFVASIRFPDNKAYFYNSKGWNVIEAYSAIGIHTEVWNTLDPDALPDRVWVVGRGESYRLLRESGFQEEASALLFQRYHEVLLDVVLLVRGTS